MGDQHGEGSDLRTASFGYWLRRRRLALDLTQAALARQVGCATSTIKKLEYDGRRPSRQMAERLADCLAIPAAEREAFIASGLGERPVDTLPVTTEPATAQALPAWLRDADDADRPEVRFVGREPELAQLQGWLAEALAGRGRVALIAGEAGRGKTALLAEFARLAQASQPDLIVAQGTCTAAAGLGDPYLPFHDILVTLAGDLEMRWQAGLLTADQARRLWDFAPNVAETILTDGPQLVDVLVPGRSLLRRRGTPQPGAIAGAGSDNVQQSQLFEQVTAVLQALARKRPLLLLVDDLQWADSASINLLFHLGRRLAGSRILFVGAYRPSEVAAGPEARGGVALQQIIREFGRLFGDMQLDLEHFDPAEARRLADALLDRELNRLDEPFRVKLFWQTHGHPLFLLELLRVLKARGQLVRDAAGYWIESGTLDWQTLPGRVTAVIAQRLAPLDQQARRVLDVASVEGERFTAEAVAAVTGHEVGQLLHLLRRDLEQRHGLVREVGALAAGGRRLTRYQFSHVLFQQYLYDGLGMGERRLLHGDVAAALEEIHAGRPDEIAVELAHHYVAAGAGKKALPYLLMAGDEARRLYAFQDATRHYERALELLQEQGDYEGAARILMKLGLTYHSAADHERARQAYERGFLLKRQIDQLPTPEQLPPAPRALRIMDTPIPATLDPTRTEEGELIAHFFSGLVRITRELEVMPDAAASWEVFDGGRIYVFHLRDDVFWSDGMRVTAGDFEFAWRRALDPTRGSSAGNLLFDVKGAAALNQSREPDAVQLGITALDDLTLRIELEQPTSYFLYVLTHGVTAPVPMHAVRALGEEWAEPENIITNGPFKLESWTKGRSLTLRRNPTYHGRYRGNVERVELLVQADQATALELYANDDLDILSVWPFSPATFRRATQQWAGEFLNWPTSVTGFVGFNVRRPPFDDPRVRRAFVLACDRQALADVHEMGRAFPATGGFVPPGLPGHVPDIALPYDLQKARQLLTDAGFPDGRGLPTITAILPPWDEVRVPEYVLKPWESELGAQFTWRVVDWAEYHAAVEDEEPHLIAYGWGGFYPDPDVYLRAGVLQISKWRNETYLRLVEEARYAVNQSKRMALYRQAEEILVEQVPFMPVLYVRHNYLVRSWVRNYQPSLNWDADWHHVIIEPH